MNMVNFSRKSAIVNFSRDELLILNAALNEICNGIDMFEYSTRIGSDHKYAVDLLQEIGALLDKMDNFQD